MSREYKNRPIGMSFRDAARGLWFCIKSERNMRIHTVVAAYTLFFACFLNLSRGEYAVLMAVIAAMITSEAFNTAIEKLCDFNCKIHDRVIGAVKDISAGAVFISAVFAACIGVVLLFKPAELTVLFMDIGRSPPKIFGLAATAMLSLVYIFIGPLGMKRWVFRILRKTGLRKKIR